MRTAPLAPAGTIAAFALIRPSSEFRVEIAGWSSPVGHTVRYPNPPCGTTGTFSEQAAAVVGIPQFRLSGTKKSREVPLPIAGPPNGPLGLRVSTRRHGVAGTNCSGSDQAPAITETVLLIRLAT